VRDVATTGSKFLDALGREAGEEILTSRIQGDQIGKFFAS
jgi:hypothetical protein